MPAAYEERLVALVRRSPWFMDILRTAGSVGLPDWAIAAGVVRTLVWDDLHGFESPSILNDVDVLFFDPRRRDEAAVDAELTEASPDYRWEVKNQAFIHEWYFRKLGVEIAPYRSVAEGIAGFVETATAVGISLERDESITVIAPFGLADVFELRLRRNPTAPDPSYFEKRVSAKGWLEKWPRLKIVP